MQKLLTCNWDLANYWPRYYHSSSQKKFVQFSCWVQRISQEKITYSIVTINISAIAMADDMWFVEYCHVNHVPHHLSRACGDWDRKYRWQEIPLQNTTSDPVPLTCSCFTDVLKECITRIIVPFSIWFQHSTVLVFLSVSASIVRIASCPVLIILRSSKRNIWLSV